ncbi:hypothetical protein F0562_005387 [Nyssa sinensis]|uniref:Uncharacterized protein n=1 Tax=Nyssa sinensis TaxID=561372 RepID=A0A5J5AKG6_9ASTE|nr:hypothetical protein F0562_005387 [Nyssa sinensis]
MGSMPAGGSQYNSSIFNFLKHNFNINHQLHTGSRLAVCKGSKAAYCVLASKFPVQSLRERFCKGVEGMAQCLKAVEKHPDQELSQDQADLILEEGALVLASQEVD